LQNRDAVRRPLYLYELMFDSKTNLTARLTDAVDLMIDFATLGEYGLEPVGRTRQGCADPASAPRRTPVRPRTTTTRATTRSAQCSLLEESGLFRAPRRDLTRSR
jgi:hypothetical protein